MSVVLSTRVRFRRWALVLGLVAALMWQGPPAFAGTATLTVDRIGFKYGSVTDDLGNLSCTSSAACTADYVQECATDGDGPVLCEPIQVQLTATVPTGFATQWTNCSESTTTTCSVFVGNATNTDSSKTVTVNYYDVQAPSVSLLAPAEGAVYAGTIGTWAFPADNDQIASVYFTWTPAGGATYTYNDTVAPYTPGLGVSELPDGPYAVTAQAFDRTGNGSSVATRNVLVDRAAPDLSVTGPGDETLPGPWLPAGSAPSWTIATSDATSGVKSLACLEDAVSGSCDSPSAHSMSPAAGSHSFAVTATDGGNNTTTVTRYFQVDGTGPAVSLKSPAKDGAINDTTPTFSPTVSDPESGVASVTCQIGSGAVSPCAGFAPTLAEGTYTLTVRATNGAGMTKKLSRTFTVDTTAPTTTIKTGPTRPFAASPAGAFTLASNETGAKLKCRLDAEPYSTCGPNLSYSGLTAGTHVFSARATDPAGNTDTTPASWTWTVPHDDQNLAATGTWTDVTGSSHYRGTASRSTQQGAALVRNDVRARRLALVATTCANCGTVDVYHGATRIKRVNLYSAVTHTKQVIPLTTYTALSGAAKVRVVVQSAGKPVIIDGLGIATR
jgi:hypothetical protein